jgi:hypothetical protein
MTLAELIQLARLLIRYSCFCELIPSQQRVELELAIDVLHDAQQMADKVDTEDDYHKIPF